MKFFRLFLCLLMPLSSYAEPCFWGSVDYLFWRAEQTGMSYVYSSEALAVTVPQDDVEGELPEFNWGSGFRVGSGYHIPCSSLDLDLSWTRFHHTTHSSAFATILIATALRGSVPDWVVGGSSALSQPATSDWQLNFDMIDLDCRLCAFSNDFFSFHPYLGIKGGVINQKQTIRYQNFIDLGTSDDVNAQVDEFSKFCGAGPKFGTSASFLFGDHFGIVGQAETALLYGSFDAPTKAQIEEPLGTFRGTKISFNENRCIPMLKVFLGVDWNCYFFSHCLVDFIIGYEAEYFWNTWHSQNSYIENILATDVGNGDLMLQGLTAKLLIAF